MWGRFRSRLNGTLRPGAFAAVVICGALLLFALPYPSGGQARRLLLLDRTTAAIAIAGPSTIDYVSPCDHDRRTIPEMLGDLSRQGVADLSVVGQPVADTLNVSAMTRRADTIRDVVVPLSYTGLDDWSTPPYRKLVSYKLMTPDYATFSAANLRELWGGLSGRPTRFQSAFSVDGRHYPDYRGIAAGEFARERAAASCPEAVTHDPVFLRDYTWWTHVETRPNGAIPALVRDLRDTLARKQKHLLVVMLPENLDLIGRLSPRWRTVVESGIDNQVGMFRADGIDVLDLTSEFPQHEFSTQWCACTHLNQAGRYHMANAIASHLGYTGFADNDMTADRLRLPGARGAR